MYHPLGGGKCHGVQIYQGMSNRAMRTLLRKQWKIINEFTLGLGYSCFMSLRLIKKSTVSDFVK
jgi:hypothetical protein